MATPCMKNIEQTQKIQEEENREQSLKRFKAYIDQIDFYSGYLFFVAESSKAKHRGLQKSTDVYQKVKTEVTKLSFFIISKTYYFGCFKIIKKTIIK